MIGVKLEEYFPDEEISFLHLNKISDETALTDQKIFRLQKFSLRLPREACFDPRVIINVYASTDSAERK